MSLPTSKQRLLEKLIGFAALLVTWAPLLVACLVVRTTSKGPVMVREAFPLVDGRMVDRYRIRTTGAGSPQFAMIGRVFQKHRIDELPVVWSLTKGDISLREFLRIFGYK